MEDQDNIPLHAHVCVCMHTIPRRLQVSMGTHLMQEPYMEHAASVTVLVIYDKRKIPTAVDVCVIIYKGLYVIVFLPGIPPYMDLEIDYPS